MKFVLFNAVVGAALAYLILAERAPESAGGIQDARPAVARVPSAVSAPIVTRAAPEALAAPRPVAPLPAVEPPRPAGLAAAPERPSTAEPVGSASRPMETPVLISPATAATAVSRPDPRGDDGSGRDMPIPEMTEEESPGRDLPQRLRDLARSMESRFLAGMK